MASNNINDDACCIKMRQNQNKNMVDYQFFAPKYSSSCSATVAPKDATNTYATYQTIPADLIAQESALTGRQTRLNKCNLRCPGGDMDSLKNQTETIPELCPIISKRTQNDFCN
jgi:hypothetical protein